MKKLFLAGFVFLVFVSAEPKGSGGCGSKSRGTGGGTAEIRCTKYPIVLAHGFSGWDEIAPAMGISLGSKDTLKEWDVESS